MALLEVSVFSQSLMRNVFWEVILPVEKTAAPFPTLYLLHGIFGNSLSWVTGSRIKRWAEDRGLAVVMPSGDNGFYVDQPDSFNLYGEYVGRELVELSRRMFPLSSRREDTSLAGFSMGGFGAVRNGLKYPDTFGSVAGLSSALVLDMASGLAEDSSQITRSRRYFASCFGDLAQALAGDKNPEVLVRSLAETSPAAIPRLYLSCGTEDSLLDANRQFHRLLGGLGVDHTYVEAPGGHDWDFWDDQIRLVLDWLFSARKSG